MNTYLPQRLQAPRRIKIGAVARHFGVSVDLLRLYEREGLIIPLKSPKGTRFFLEQDFVWIGTVIRLVREARLNFAGIRHLLALLPCWTIKRCGNENRANCPNVADSTSPCWSKPEGCADAPAGCYSCEVYRSAPACENLKALLAVSVAKNNDTAGAVAD